MSEIPVYRYDAPVTCAHEHHEHHEPVYAYLHAPKEPGDRVLVANDGEPVARICTDCRAPLPPNFGCGDCSWYEERRLCDPVPSLLLGQPCPAHARAGQA